MNAQWVTTEFSVSFVVSTCPWFVNKGLSFWCLVITFNNSGIHHSQWIPMYQNWKLRCVFLKYRCIYFRWSNTSTCVGFDIKSNNERTACICIGIIIGNTWIYFSYINCLTKTFDFRYSILNPNPYFASFMSWYCLIRKRVCLCFIFMCGKRHVRFECETIYATRWT